MIRPLQSFYKTLKSWFGGSYPKIIGSGNTDWYSNLREPSVNGLINEYKKISFACANINAFRCASVQLKLYVTTSKSQKSPRVLTKTLSTVEKKDISSRFSVRSGLTVEEVVEHPVLDLLKNVNESPFINGNSLRVWTELYKQVTGVCYWRIYPNFLGGIAAIDILPSQYVTPVKETTNSSPVDYYKYENPYTTRDENIPIELIIAHRDTNLNNPLGSGRGWVRAAFEDISLANKTDSIKTGMLDRDGRPDALVSPYNNEASLGADMSKRMEKELNMRFGNGRSGGFLVFDEPLKIEFLNNSFKELISEKLDEATVVKICAAAGVPSSFIINSTANKATLEAALTQLAMLSIEPRCSSYAANLTTNLLPWYDKTGRLFFGFENPVPEDRKTLLQESVQLCMNGIITPNEARFNYNYEPLPGGDELRPINVSPEIVRNNQRENGSAKQ